MIDVKTLNLLAGYNCWADEVLFDAMTKLREGAIYQKSNTLFGSMIGTLNHNYQVDLIWQAHLTQREHRFTSRRDILHAKFEDLVRAQAEANSWFAAWTEEQTPVFAVRDSQFQIHIRAGCSDAKSCYVPARHQP
jgi:uncharacterized damage-inducible protein DinB